MNPSRLADWLAACRVPRDEREFVLGDLHEEFAELAGVSGLGTARRWHWRQALRILFLRRSRYLTPLGPQPRKPLMQNFLHDVRFGLRLLRHSPAFTTVVTMTLAMGIGATTAIYSVVHAALLAPLPFANPDRLVLAYNGGTFETSTRLSYPQVIQWRDTSGAFESFAGYFTWRSTLTGQREAAEVQGIRTTASLFKTLGIEPIMGRLFTQAEEAVSAERVVLVTESMWRRTFDADPGIVGRRIALNDQTFTIIGVVPDWRLRPTDNPPDMVGPLRVTEKSAPADLMFMSGVARLRPSETVAQAQEQLLSSVLRADPNAEPKPKVFLMPLRDRFVVNSRGVLMALMGAVGFLLLITCANLANLQLARAINRRKEIAVRLALGAGRGRIVTQLLTECVILSALGGLAGVLVAWLGMRSVASLTTVAEAGVYDLNLNWSVLAFAAGVSLAVGILFGLIPALQTGKVSFAVDLRAGNRVATGKERLRSVLVVAEVALTLVLLVGAGLLTRSLANLISVDKGFSSDSVLSFNLSTSAKYATGADQTRFFESALERISRLPGVEAVGLTSQLPIAGGDTYGGVDIEGFTFPPGQRPTAQKRIVSPDYFAAMGIPIKTGRLFTAADHMKAPAVMVVSETFARQRFPNQDPIGKRVALLWDIDGFQTIVGVVSDVKHNGLDDPANAAVYVSYLQRPDSAFTVVVKTSVSPESITSQVRNEIRAIDPDRPLTSIRTMQAVVADSVGARQLSLELVGGFAVIGLLLAVTGIYGVVSYATQQRTREFGIRLALGAGSRSVLGLVLRQGLGLAVIGLVLGLGGALALGGLIRSQLFGVETTDPITLASVSVGLIGVALLACYLPARRAIKVNPASVLRSE